MRAVVIGAGLGGLGDRAAAAGARPRGDASSSSARGRAAAPTSCATRGFTWDTGPSLLTMPWVLEETFAAGGLDLHSEVTLRRLDPLYRIRWAGEARAPRLLRRPRRGCAPRWRSSPPRDAARVEPFLAALRADLRAGRSSAPGGGRSLAARDFARLVPAMLRLDALRAAARASSRATSATRACARRSPSTRCSSAATRTACRRSTPRSSTCRSLDGGWYADGGVYSRRRGDGARRSTCAAASRSSAIEHAGGRVTGVAARGRRADRGRRRRLQRRRPAHARAARAAAPPRRRLRETMSCFLLYLGTDRPFAAAAAPHAARRATATASSSATSRAGASCRAPSPPTCTRRRAPSRRWRRPAATRSPSCCRSRTCAPGSTGSARPTGCATRCSTTSRRRFGLHGLRDAIVGRAPHDAAGLRARARRRRGATRSRSSRRCTSRPGFRAAQPRPPARPGSTSSAAGRIPAPASPACCSAPRSPPGSSPRDHALRAARAGGDGRDASPRRRRSLARGARDDATASRARSRSPAGCSRAPSATTSTCSTSCSARSTTSSTTASRTPRERVAAVDDWAHGRAGERTREVAMLEDAGDAPSAPALGAGRLLRGDALGPRGPRRSTPRRSSTRYCYRVAGTVGHRDGVGARHDATTARAGRAAAALGMAMQRTNILRDLDEDGAAGRSYLARETTDRFGAPRPGRARGAAARPDREGRRALRRGHGRASSCCAAGRSRGARGGLDVPRDPAPDRARRLRRATPAARPCRAGASSGSRRARPDVTCLDLTGTGSVPSRCARLRHM